MGSALDISAAPWLQDAEQLSRAQGRPLITLSYAQSLDSCLTAARGQETTISGPAALRLTHSLRAAHDAILVGIDTVIADDPQLTVRLVEGRNPQPVILDSRLRIPLHSNLLKRSDKLPWIFCRQDADPEKVSRLEQSGAQVIPVSVVSDERLDLDAVLAFLQKNQVHSLMVEGGARVIQSFLEKDCVDWGVITIAPIWLGGAAMALRLNNKELLSLDEPNFEVHGRDIVIAGKVRRGEITS